MITVGIDEVGRGPWAGPVTAAAVILPNNGLNHCVIGDSKALSAATRRASAAVLLQRAQAGIGHASPAEIDALGLGPAIGLAMLRALQALAAPFDRVLLDGKHVPAALRSLNAPITPIVRGDALEPAIGAASIVAKVCRDAAMQVLDVRYPGYGFARHVGYGTLIHREALARLGVSPVHRRSFKPVTKICVAHV